MTDVQDKMHELFTRAALADDLGYPDHVSFLPGDQPWADRAAWELLHDERKAVVVVTAEHEILLMPRPPATARRSRGSARASAA